MTHVGEGILDVAECVLDDELVIGERLVAPGFRLVDCRGKAAAGIDRPDDVAGEATRCGRIP